MARFDARYWSVRGVGLAFVLGACNQVLDIEPASIDPRLTAVGRAGASHAAAGTGGSLAAAAGTGATSGTGASPTSGGTGDGTGGSSHDRTPSGGSTSADAGEAGDSKPATGAGGGSSGTTHGSDDHGASGEGGEAGQKSAPPDPCDEYCDLMDANCLGNDEQYRDRDQCTTICHLLPQGTAGGTDDDSIECRLKYVEKTRYANGSELSTYCQQAGPSGDGSCGNVCQAYCVLMAEVCTPDVAGMYHFASDADCMQTCQGLPAATIPYSFTNPLVSDGNHALCRLFHVTSAAMADADEHCEHAMGVTLCEATSQ